MENCRQLRPDVKRHITLFTLLILALLASLTTPPARAVDYLADIKPLLHERCYACHGALKQKKSLRLDTRRSTAPAATRACTA